VPGARLAVLDEDGHPLPRGEAGELAVHAPTMMRGYWRRPDLDAAALIDLEEAGALRRYYRTGDIVRDEGEGALVFVGRRDRQIKTRGYRVELDAVEAALAAHPGVAEAASFPVDAGEGLTLVGAAVREAGPGALDLADLRQHLSQRLPAYAAPQRIDVLPEFPRTSTGKIDRRRLAAEAAATPAR
jgi:Acyl-CoA synthetases (AMP-forming)/AMP-acid ligases II